MIRPLYRWKSFWLGLFVLVFLGWAWRDSFRNDAEVADGAWKVESATGGVMMLGFAERVNDFKTEYEEIPPDWYPEWAAFQPLFWIRRPEPESLFVEGDYLWHERAVAARNARDLYPAYMENWPLSRWMVFIPYWLILLVAALAWLAFLAWRWRRLKRLQREAEPSS